MRRSFFASVTSPDRIVIRISDIVPGSTNDLTLLRESPPDFGR